MLWVGVFVLLCLVIYCFTVGGLAVGCFVWLFGVCLLCTLLHFGFMLVSLLLGWLVGFGVDLCAWWDLVVWGWCF